MKKSAAGFGFFLIMAGVLWILSLFDVFNVSILTSFFKLWPLIFIAIGFSIIFSHNQVIRFIVWVVFFAVIVFYSVFGPFSWLSGNDNNSTEAEEFTRSESLQSVTEKGVIKLDVGGATVNIGSTSTNLFEADIFDRKIEFDTNIQKTADVRIFSNARNTSTGPEDKFKWDVKLSDKIPWEVELDAGAVKGELDFRAVALNKLLVNIGASSLDIKFSDLSSLAEVSIKAGVSSINLEVPAGAGVRVKLQGALVSKNFTGAGLEKNGDYYYSSNYDNAEHKINISIEMGIGSIDLKYK